jgi:hypothetical protein
MIYVYKSRLWSASRKVRDNDVYQQVSGVRCQVSASELEPLYRSLSFNGPS